MPPPLPKTLVVEARPTAWTRSSGTETRTLRALRQALVLEDEALVGDADEAGAAAFAVERHPECFAGDEDGDDAVVLVRPVFDLLSPKPLTSAQ